MNLLEVGDPLTAEELEEKERLLEDVSGLYQFFSDLCVGLLFIYSLRKKKKLNSLCAGFLIMESKRFQYVH